MKEKQQQQFETAAANKNPLFTHVERHAMTLFKIAHIIIH